VLAVMILIAAQLLARLAGYRYLRHKSVAANILALVAGLSGLAWIPVFTHSHLNYVATVFDWIVMTGAILSVACFALLVFHPLSYLVRSRG
jgi:hypothetical protein